MKSRINPTRNLLAILAAMFAFSATLAVMAPPASASTIVYQCGGGVCAVDPDTDAAPRTLTGDGLVTGITEDGKTASWVTGSSLVERPLSAGGRNLTLFDGEIYDFPRISPDGTRALWSFFLSGYGWFTYLAPSTGSGYPPAVASSTYQTSHGWLGSSPLVARRGFDANLARICAEAVGGASCDTLIATDPDSQVSFPSGSRDGDSVVAVRGPAPSTFGIPLSGRISIYSSNTKTRVRDVTAGTDDAYPSFSFEGDRVTFERSGEIYVVAATGGTPRKVATGSMPFWGGKHTVPGDPPDPPTGPGDPGDPGGGDPVSAPKIASKSLRLRKGMIPVTIRCAGSARCAGKASIKKGRKLVAGRAYSLKAGRRGTVKLKPTRRGIRILGKARRQKVTVQLKPKRGKPVSRKLTLSR